MISRVWHGWTNRDNADAYEELLRLEIFSSIAKRSIQGYQGIHLLRCESEDEVEFVTIMWFDTIDAVKTFAGEEYEIAVVPPEARKLLSRFDKKSTHYHVLETPE